MPEHLAIDLMHGPVAEGRVDRAVVMRVMRTARAGMVDGGVHVLADEIGRGPSQHPLRGWVDEGGDPVGVDAVDPLPAARRISRLPRSMSRKMRSMRCHSGRPARMCASASRSMRRRSRSSRSKRVTRSRVGSPDSTQPEYSRRSALPAPWRGVSVRPPLPLGENRLREHHERRPLVGMQGAHRHRPQGSAVVAEQRGGRRVGVVDAVCQGLEHQHRLAILIEGEAINRRRFER